MNTRPGRSLRRREALTGYAFVLPQLIGFTFFVLVPLVNVFIYSFHNKNMLFGTNIFIGFDNYTKLFTNDSLFWMTLKNTFVFSVLLVPMNLVLALLLALYLGDGEIIHASYTAGKVIISQLVSSSSDYYKRNFHCARRVFS